MDLIIIKTLLFCPQWSVCRAGMASASLRWSTVRRDKDVYTAAERHTSPYTRHSELDFSEQHDNDNILSTHFS